MMKFDATLPPYATFTQRDRDRFLYHRQGETRIGEKIVLLPEWDSLADFPKVKFVILGIPEGIGPLANRGRAGARQGWFAFLRKFLNMQDNRFLRGDTIAIAGTVTTIDLPDQVNAKDYQPDAFDDIQAMVSQLDGRVAKAVQDLQLPDGVTLIVIGGGHNNAYPIMKGLGPGATVVNLDPHADYRAKEGRHSGNPFRYAMEEGLMARYYPVGLHKAYNNEEAIEAMEGEARVEPLWWDYISDPEQIFYWVTERLKGHGGKYIGLEMDMDGLAQMPSSAYSPEGFTPREARRWMRCWAQTFPNTKYLHLPEAAPENPREVDFAGKMLAYLVHDFMSNQLTS
ncbi:MAG: arginase family protein [Bacteroidota bacterium]